MKVTASSPYGPLSESLTALAQSADACTLRAHLQGQRLPAVGGNTEPAETILRALGETPDPKELAARLAPVLAQVINESKGELKDGLTPVSRLLLYQSLLLAVDLPPDPELAASLLRLVSELEEKVPGFWLKDSLAPPAVRALVHQQTDARAEFLWYRLLKGSGQDSSWTPQQRTILLSAWRGLLYIPPEPEAAHAGNIVNTDRIDRGLSILGAGGSQLAHLALEILDQTFPRSPQFWTRCLAPLLDNWPPMLREAVLQQWPKVAPAESLSPVRHAGRNTGRSRSALKGRFASAGASFNQNVEPFPQDIRP